MSTLSYDLIFHVADFADHETQKVLVLTTRGLLQHCRRALFRSFTVQTPLHWRRYLEPGPNHLAFLQSAPHLRIYFRKLRFRGSDVAHPLTIAVVRQFLDLLPCVTDVDLHNVYWTRSDEAVEPPQYPNLRRLNIAWSVVHTGDVFELVRLRTSWETVRVLACDMTRVWQPSNSHKGIISTIKHLSFAGIGRLSHRSLAVLCVPSDVRVEHVTFYQVDHSEARVVSKLLEKQCHVHTIDIHLPRGAEGEYILES